MESENKGTNWLNLAFNYHKSADFGQILNAAGALKDVSLNKITAAKISRSMRGGPVRTPTLVDIRIIPETISLVCLLFLLMVVWLMLRLISICLVSISMVILAPMISTLVARLIIRFGLV